MGGLIGTATPEKNGLLPKNNSIEGMFIPSYTDTPNLATRISAGHVFSCLISISAANIPPGLYYITKHGTNICCKILFNHYSSQFNIKVKKDANKNIYINKRFGGESAFIFPLYNLVAYSITESVDISSLELTDVVVE